jgi:hypothetical protein
MLKGYGLVTLSPLQGLLRPRGRTSTFARVAASALLAGLGIALLPRGDAHAIVAGCRSDPVIVVDGDVADIVSTLYTDSSAISELDYTISVPPGSLIGKTTLTVGLGFPEKVTYVFDPTVPTGTIEVHASVVTRAGVPAFTTMVSVSTLYGHASTAGMSDAIVPVTVTNQLML